MSLFAFLDESNLDLAASDALAEARYRLPIKRRVRYCWKNYRTTAGRAYFREALICLSKNLLDNKEKVRETLLHEYAHLVVYEKFGPAARSHGPEWKVVMRVLGLQPDAYHTYECERQPKERNLVYLCSRCGAEIPRTRPLKRNRIYTHIGCGGHISKLKPERSS